MAKAKKLKPFSIAGRLSSCPECGATGDYALLKHSAEVVQAKLDRFAKENPVFESFASGPFADLKAAVGVMTSVIGKMK